MATRTVVCPECESPLQPGRFSCSACGALVASVATVARSFDEPDVLTPVEPAGPGVAPEPRSTTGPTAGDDGWDDVRDGAAFEPAPANGHLADEIADDLPLASAMALATDEPPVAVAEPPPTADEAESYEPVEVATAVADIAPPAIVEPGPSPEPAWPDHPTWPLPTVDPRTPPAILGMAGEPHEEPDPDIEEANAPTPSAEMATAPTRVPAGVYLPPSAVLPPGEALPVPAMAAAAAAPASESTGANPASDGPRSGIAASMNWLAVPADAGTRTIAIGGGIAILGFLLPWADPVIGSRSLDGELFSTWGLAGPAAPIALILVLGLTALAILRPHLPAWVGVSWPAIALAALLVGILWPYLFGSFGAMVGVYVVTVGAVVLAAGGIIERVVSRHAEPPAGV